MKYTSVCKTCNYIREFDNKIAYQKAERRVRCNRCSHGSVYLSVLDKVNDERTKTCPSCAKIQKYDRNDVYYRALKNNTKCNSCREFSENHKNNLSVSRKKRKMPPEMYVKRAITVKKRFPNGIKKSKESVSKSVNGLKEWRKNNPEKSRDAILRSRATKIKRYGTYFVNCEGPMYNKKACDIFDKINKELRWKGIHATNNLNGEYVVSIDPYNTFYVDYYEPEKNIVIEFDERYHFKPSTNKKYEKSRQTRIVKHLGCRFFRIKYDDNINEFITKLKNE
jgi:very-short-patch-repair endonuclease